MKNNQNSRIAIVGAGPAGVVMAIALARKGIYTTVYDRDQHPELAPRFNPDRSYSIDVTGHGLKALQYINACDVFDRMLIPFKGIKTTLINHVEPWDEPGWTGSRGDIMRALLCEAETKYAEWIDFQFNCLITAVNVIEGNITFTQSGEECTKNFDLIIGADGGGSVVRHEMEYQLPEFSTQYDEIPNYATMLELDQNTADFDKRYLYILSNNPFCIAGAVDSGQNDGSVRWFCVVGTNFEQTFASVQEARRLFEKRAPEVLKRVSNDSLSSFVSRKCFHIGRMLSCSQLYGGKAVLLGDAGAPFSPIGQGINAAMESAIWLDREIKRDYPADLYQAAVRYSNAWKPEADAISWISRKFVFTNSLHDIRMLATSKLRLNALSNAKKSQYSYREVKQQAERLGILWR